jgi:hypothetical protein
MVSPLPRLAIVKFQAVYLSFEVYKNVSILLANGREKAKLGGQKRRGRGEERRGDESRGEERRGEESRREEKKKKRELANPVHW